MSVQAWASMKETSSKASRTTGPYLSWKDRTVLAKSPLRRVRAYGMREMIHILGPGTRDRGWNQRVYVIQRV